MIKKLALALIILLSAVFILNGEEVYSKDNQLDLNYAALEDIMKLPIDEKLAENIFNFREYDSYFRSVYDLLKVEGMTPETFQKIKNVVFVLPPTDDDVFTRLENIYYKISGWKSEEGGNTAMVDEYVDLAKEPFNVNIINEEKLLSIKNVSPIDAAAIIEYRNRGGKIDSAYKLRRVPNLQHYAYTNLRDFVKYNDKINKPLNIDYQIKISTYDPSDEFSDVFLEPSHFGDDLNANKTWHELAGYDEAIPEVSNKLKFNYMNTYKGGVNFYNQYGDTKLIEKNRTKAFVGVQNRKFNNFFQLHNLVVGHYKVSFGQGLVMDNTDYYKPRVTGYGYDTRLKGVLGDLSKTEEYSLLGTAAEFTLMDNLYGIAFFSRDEKDALLFKKGNEWHVFDYIILPGGINDEFLDKYVNDNDDGYKISQNAVTETTYGGYLKYKFRPGLYLGVSGYESQYDHYWGAKSDSSVTLAGKLSKTTKTDNEIRDGFDNTEEGKYRRVIGFDGGLTYKNLAWNGEYSKVLDHGAAWITNLSVIYSTFNLLFIARDYDVDYTNPYNRAYSEKEKYNDTILEDAYYLKNPLMGLLFENSVEPQAERGAALSARAQLSQQITITKLFYDIYQLKADGRWFDRFEGEVEYKFAHPFRVRYRKKILRRNIENDLTFRRGSTDMNIFKLLYNLSNHDRLQLTYWNAHNSEVPRISTPFRGESRLESYGVFADFKHNFSSKTSVSLNAGFWEGGGFYSFDGPFFDNMESESGQKLWVEYDSKISNNMAVKFFYRVIRDNSKYRTVYDSSDNIIGIYEDTMSISNTFYVQLDYMW